MAIAMAARPAWAIYAPEPSWKRPWTKALADRRGFGAQRGPMRTNRNKLNASAPFLITLAMLWVAGPVGAEEPPTLAPGTSAASTPDAAVHPVDDHQMQADMHRYFKGEKQ